LSYLEEEQNVEETFKTENLMDSKTGLPKNKKPPKNPKNRQKS
jgi:hypothetical protein